MEQDRIVAPEEISTLPVEDLIERAVPLLRRAGLTAHPEARARHTENVPAALSILLKRWQRDPRSRQHKGQELDFADFVAIHLAHEVRALDQEQRPDLYDNHRRYHTSSGYEGLEPPGPLDEEAISQERYRPEESSTAALLAEMTRQGIPVASQLGVLGLLAGVRDGEITNGRQAAKALGDPAHKVHPATGALHAALDLLENVEEERGSGREGLTFLDPREIL